MIFNVQMLAFMNGEIRHVNVPDAEIQKANTQTILECIFYYGQNDFQPSPDRPSVSVGDVVEVDGRFYLCRPVGWREITPADLEEYKKIERRDRHFCEFIYPKGKANG